MNNNKHLLQQNIPKLNFNKIAAYQDEGDVENKKVQFNSFRASHPQHSQAQNTKQKTSCLSARLATPKIKQEDLVGPKQPQREMTTNPHLYILQQLNTINQRKGKYTCENTSKKYGMTVTVESLVRCCQDHKVVCQLEESVLANRLNDQVRELTDVRAIQHKMNLLHQATEILIEIQRKGNNILERMHGQLSCKKICINCNQQLQFIQQLLYCMNFRQILMLDMKGIDQFMNRQVQYGWQEQKLMENTKQLQCLFEKIQETNVLP
eukprot:TRINITY_DN31416_c0_g1_i1.p1 TRINITY_DN31416_c0_g1~~TRINITY_DN31416_c0_g1_i1.p1  ORF type:complete len:275 (-),score=10.79 TRINITY_DN31416_c0_g1_i1:159-953(-)